MKNAITARTAFLSIAAFLFSAAFAPLVSGAEEGVLIKAAIVKDGAGMKNIRVHTIRAAGGWALAALTYNYGNRGARGASALLKKSDGNWRVMQFSGKTPTTDLLKQNNVPSNYRGDLIDRASVAKTKPILVFLHSKYPRLSFESVEISGDHALAAWYGGNEAGMTLLKRSGLNAWKVLLSTGGAIDEGAMRQYSVPVEHMRELMGIE